MGTTKSGLFSEEQNRIAKLAKAFGHPARIGIIAQLARMQACICNDIVKELPLSQPTISQHLKVLKEAGLVKGELEGNAVCYCINGEVVDELITYLQGLRQELSQKEACSSETC